MANTGTWTQFQNMQFNVGDLAVDGVVMASSPAQIDAATSVSLTGGHTTVAADVLAIPITHASVQKTTGGDAEALTLADGTVGQLLSIHLVTDGGGTGTLTPATPSGYVSIAFADAGDNVLLQFTETGWAILVNSGCTVTYS